MLWPFLDVTEIMGRIIKKNTIKTYSQMQKLLLDLFTYIIFFIIFIKSSHYCWNNIESIPFSNVKYKNVWFTKFFRSQVIDLSERLPTRPISRYHPLIFLFRFIWVINTSCLARKYCLRLTLISCIYYRVPPFSLFTNLITFSLDLPRFF